MSGSSSPGGARYATTAPSAGVRSEQDGEGMYRALFDSIDDGVFLFERLPRRPDGLRDYRYLALNPAVQAMFGIADLTGQSMRDNFPDEVEDWYDDYDYVLETGQSIRFERESLPQGMVLEVYIARIEDGTGNRLLAVVHDITERRRAEQALAQSEARFRALVQTSSDIVFEMSADWSELRSIAARNDVVDASALRGEALANAIDPLDRPRIKAAVVEGIRDKAPVELEHTYRRADGGVAWCTWRAVPMLDHQGQIVEWIGMARDITERKRLSEARYRSLFESIGEGFCIIEVIFDDQGRPIDYRFLEVNPSFERQSGIPRPLGRTMREIAPNLEPHWFERYGRVATTGEPTRFRQHAAPLGRWFDVNAWRCGAPYERQVAVVFNDVTASVRYEESLRELNESLEERVEERTRQVRELAGRLTLTELEERRRISQIVHDDLQQLLYGIEMKLSQVGAALPSAVPASLRADLGDAHAWVGHAITTTRRLTVDLSPPILQKEGLTDALEWLQRQMRELHGLEVTLLAAHAFYLPDQDLRVLLFQIVRELLFNVKKHAGTQHVTVRIEEAGGDIVIHVVDAGTGFDVAAAAAREASETGFGLSSVRERLGLIGGRLVVRSSEGQGTHIEVHAPSTRVRLAPGGGPVP